MISRTDIAARCLTLARKRGNNISLDSHLVNDGGFDSLDHVDLAFDVEDEFGVKIIDEELEHLHTVDDYADLLFNKLMREERADQATRGITRKGS